jgi:hypothetical protein
MNDQEIQKIFEETYDESRETTISSMLKDFYNRRMLSIVIFLWVWGLLFFVGAVYSAVQFFKDIEMKSQLMYVAIFLCCCQFLGMIKVFAWQIIHRNGLRREIKRLELRIAQLNETVKPR